MQGKNKCSKRRLSEWKLLTLQDLILKPAMKKYLIALLVPLMVITSCAQHRSKAERLMANNGKEVLNLYRFAADEADAIYWEQNFGDKSVIEALQDPSEKAYAMINYGPWDRIDGEPFIAGYGDKPAGACFYPQDMTPTEFSEYADPAKDSPYTLITRADDGSLKTVWYHDAYADHIEKIADYLTAAADITIKESVRNYLLKMAEGLRTDDYYEAEKAWLEMTDSKMDLVIGPNETVDDNLFGRKASFGAYVLLKNLDRTEKLSRMVEKLPFYQSILPGEAAYHEFVPQSASNIFSCDAIYYGGYTNAGYKVIAINFPYDARLQEEIGTRTILFDNIIREKFNRTLFPAGMLLFEGEDAAHLDANAFYWNIVFREIAKGLGVKETVNGRGTVADALSTEALTFEKAKSNVLGTYLCAKEVADHQIDALIQKEDVLATFIANVIRSCRFGDADATGRANLMVYNYLLEKGAISLKESGRYAIDYAKTESAIESLGAQILKIQATGDLEAAKAFTAYYSVVSTSLKSDIVLLEKERIPVDIRFKYE